MFEAQLLMMPRGFGTNLDGLPENLFFSTLSGRGDSRPSESACMLEAGALASDAGEIWDSESTRGLSMNGRKHRMYEWLVARRLVWPWDLQEATLE